MEIAADHPAWRVLSAQAVRERCLRVMASAERDATEHLRWHPERLDDAADYVVGVIRARYPSLAVPCHSRWRHFAAGGVDRWRDLVRMSGLSGTEAARTAIDLLIPSVLLDAGAGAEWRYRDVDRDVVLARSEGLAVASLALFASGALSATPGQPLRSDASALARLRSASLAAAFQVTGANPLVGLAGRVELLRRLGEVANATPDVFGTPARLGSLFDYVALHAVAGRVKAAFLVETLLRALGPVWPSRIALDGVPLGDCWRHDAAKCDPGDPTDGLVPFHKLTQWLAYSLIEPLAEAGIEVVEPDALTGLPEYRNGGLLLDLGVLQPRSETPASLARRRWPVDSPLVVEWRALTVIALDRLAVAVRKRLGVDAAEFPLARVLEGGTWAAGRAIAAERRAGGAPPLDVGSDGTVF